MSKLFLPFIKQRNIFLALYIFIILISPQHLLSTTIINNIEGVTTETNPQTTWNLSADILRSKANNTIIEAQGNVVLTKGLDIFKADFARFYQETNWILLKGNVFISIDQDDMNADEAEFNLVDKTGWILNGKVFMPVPHIYFSSEYIEKNINNQYTITNAKITTCDGLKPAWSISAEEAVVNLDGYTRLYHSKFHVKDISLIYSPIITLPTKNVRQTGFLTPNYGISQKRGLYYTQPYFWNINESSDITFYGGFMEKVGPLASVRYRSHPVTQQKTWLAATGIHSRHAITKPGTDLVYPSSNLVRSNKERYWFRGMADGFIGASTWRYVSNIDYVSDQDYLREFDQGLVSFSKSRNEMFHMFGRDIHEDDQNRLSALLVRNDWERVGFVFSTYYSQDPTFGHGNKPHSQNETTQQIPQTDIFLYQSKLLPYVPFEGEVRLQSTYMYRIKGTQGWRNEIYPKLILPIDLIYGSARASVGLRGTYYLTSVKDHTTPISLDTSIKKTPKQNGTHRTIMDLDLDLYTQANNTWYLQNKKTIKLAPENVGKTFWTALRHNIQPRIRYQYIPKVNQEKNPFYILEDRLVQKNECTFSISNIFTRKASKVIMSSDEEDSVPMLSTSYLDILRWQILSGYDFEENKRKIYLKKFPKRPFMDIMSELDISALSWLSYTGKTFISPYTGKVTRHDHSITYYYNNVFAWTTGLSFRTNSYEYQRRIQFPEREFLNKKIKLIQNTFSVQPNPNWLFTFEDFRNLQKGGDFGKVNSQSIEIAYIAQCYTIIAKYRYDGYDKSFTIMFELPGIFD